MIQILSVAVRAACPGKNTPGTSPHLFDGGPMAANNYCRQTYVDASFNNFNLIYYDR